MIIHGKAEHPLKMGTKMKISEYEKQKKQEGANGKHG